jgi:hypothetical protein
VYEYGVEMKLAAEEVDLWLPPENLAVELDNVKRSGVDCPDKELGPLGH